MAEDEIGEEAGKSGEEAGKAGEEAGKAGEEAGKAGKAGKETGEAGAGLFGAADPIGAIGVAFDIGMGIYSEIQTEKFQRELLEKIDKIEQQLVSLKADFDSFESEYNLSSKLQEYGNPFIQIYGTYGDDKPDDSTIGGLSLDQVNDAMNNVKDLLSGSNKGDLTGKKLMDLLIDHFIGRARDSSKPPVSTSIIELAYSYFSNRIFPSLYVGYSILKKHDYSPKDNVTVLDSWKKELVKSEDGSGAKAQHLADKVQELVNNRVRTNPNLLWIDYSHHPNIGTVTEVKKLQVGRSATIPEGNVITGIQFINLGTKEDAVAAIQLVYGKVDANGYVDPSSIASKLQGSEIVDPNTYNNSYDRKTNRLIEYPISLVSSKPVIVPDGKVITNVAFTRINYNHKTKHGDYSYNGVNIFGLEIEIGELKISNSSDKGEGLKNFDVEIVNKEWLNPIESDVTIPLNLKNIIGALFKKGGVNNEPAKEYQLDFYNSTNSDFYFHFREWNLGLNRMGLDIGTWDVPITGVQINRNSQAQFEARIKSDFHKNMFNK